MLACQIFIFENLRQGRKVKHFEILTVINIDLEDVGRGHGEQHMSNDAIRWQISTSMRILFR